MVASGVGAGDAEGAGLIQASFSSNAEDFDSVGSEWSKRGAMLEKDRQFKSLI